MQLGPNPIETIRKTIEEKKRPRTQKIHDLLQQIDKLRSEIEAEKSELKSELIETFEILEKAIASLPKDQRTEAQKILDEYKLKSLELLGILAETTEAAIITALEKAQNVEETVFEITKDLAHQTIDINVDTRHIQDVSQTILQVAANLSEASINYADEILRGTILGVKKGIRLSIKKFYQTIQYTPDEARTLIIENYASIIENLPHMDEIYMQTIHKVANQSEPGIKEKIEIIAKNSETLIEKIKNEAEIAANLLKSRFEDLTHIPSVKLDVQEAKKLGLRAFSKAKETIENAIKGAKDALGK
ncbi:MULTISPECIES: hypothetical protein [unclassified Nitratiruptor]|uniref:hypothetical protein n=1 Tax=unclassified Nitratiruptor TaxID=2624044 RepID=UPI0019153681|nr:MULTISPECIES: hypothetical protein [unclassified Nitratiruptor]BCD60989.1 hypothetical protein NitYY0810_C1770 [Nitratiruptor sp. YY08-10]BCD64921.1 hypothetical protein NitYY0814_C1778 [Nitratiruptor sp. YY08-14]